VDGALQEADESGLWLELLRDDCGIESNELGALLAETAELIGIFTTMASKTKRARRRLKTGSVLIFQIVILLNRRCLGDFYFVSFSGFSVFKRCAPSFQDFSVLDFQYFKNMYLPAPSY